MKSSTNSEINRCSLSKNEASGTSAVTSSTPEGQSQSAEPPIQALRQRMQQLVNTVQTMQKRCDQLSLQNAAGRSQQQALNEQLTALMQARDQLSTERYALAASHQELASQWDGLLQKHESLKRQLEEMQSLLNSQSAQTTVAQERDALASERETLVQERNSLAIECQNLSAQAQSLEADNISLLQKFNKLNIDQEALHTQLLEARNHVGYLEKLQGKLIAEILMAAKISRNH